MIKNLIQIRENISELRKQISEKEKKKAVIEQKIKNIDKLLEEGKCSMCGQEIQEEKRFKAQEYLKKEVNELKAGLEEKKKLKEKLEYSTEIRNWIKEQFPVLLRDIERQILVSSFMWAFSKNATPARTS